MRTPLLFAVLGLLIVEALLVPRAVSDWKTMRRLRAESTPETALPSSLSPFAGFDAAGRPLAMMTDETRWVLPVMIHSARLSADLDYLNRLRKAVPSRAFALVAVCDANQCGDHLRAAPASTFPILAYGSYAPLSEIARFDGRGELLLMNQFWGVKQSVRRSPSPEDLAAEIQRITER
jgi:hypothetical protein